MCFICNSVYLWTEFDSFYRERRYLLRWSWVSLHFLLVNTLDWYLSETKMATPSSGAWRLDIRRPIFIYSFPFWISAKQLENFPKRAVIFIYKMDRHFGRKELTHPHREVLKLTKVNVPVCGHVRYETFFCKSYIFQKKKKLFTFLKVTFFPAASFY